MKLNKNIIKALYEAKEQATNVAKVQSECKQLGWKKSSRGLTFMVGDRDKAHVSATITTLEESKNGVAIKVQITTELYKSDNFDASNNKVVTPKKQKSTTTGVSVEDAIDFIDDITTAIKDAEEVCDRYNAAREELDEVFDDLKRIS
jgi:hypothetical protein